MRGADAALLGIWGYDVGMTTNTTPTTTHHCLDCYGRLALSDDGTYWYCPANMGHTSYPEPKPAPTDTEVSRRTFRATLPERHGRGCGPVILAVVIYDHGPGYVRTFSVEIDGQHSTGGFARHLGDDGLPSFLPGWNLGTEVVADDPTEAPTDPDYPRDHNHPCPECGATMMDPAPAGSPGDDHYYCDACGAVDYHIPTEAPATEVAR